MSSSHAIASGVAQADNNWRAGLESWQAEVASRGGHSPSLKGHRRQGRGLVTVETDRKIPAAHTLAVCGVSRGVAP